MRDTGTRMADKLYSTQEQEKWEKSSKNLVLRSVYITTLCVPLTSEEARADDPLSTLLLFGSAFSLNPRRRGLITLFLYYYSLALRSPYLRGGKG